MGWRHEAIDGEERRVTQVGEALLLARDAATARDALRPVCSSRRWLDEVLGGWPYPSVDALVEASTAAVLGLPEDDLDEALAGHPRIGERGGAHAAASGREQAGMADADEALRQAVAEGNRAYEERFGHVYLVRARGRSGEELLQLLHDRLDNDPGTERVVVRRQLAEINALRLRDLVGR